MHYSLPVFMLRLFSVFVLGLTPLLAEQIQERNEDRQCWIVSSQSANAALFDAWKALFAPLDITCEFKGNLKELDETTDLSKVKFMIVDTSIINEGFARDIERWVKAGGVVMTSNPPIDYFGPPEKWRPFVTIEDGTTLNQGLLRPFSAAAFKGGSLASVDGPESSLVFSQIKEAGLCVPEKEVKVSSLKLITGWAGRDFGPDMTILEGRIKSKDSFEFKATLMIRNRYGLGWGYYSTLPFSADTPLGAALRNGLMRQIGIDMKTAVPRNKPLYNNPPGIAVESVKEKAAVPERPAPPADCLLELHGDEFSGAIGSPSWAPWRIALGNEGRPIKKEFAIPKTDVPLWMKIKGCYGDHNDPPPMSVTFNGATVFNGICPWTHIQYSAKYYGSMYPISVYLPKESLREMNTLSVVNYGPEWFVLDYVRFFPVVGDRSLEKVEASDTPGKLEVKVSHDSPIANDGNPAKPAWERATWIPLGLEEGGKATEAKYSAAFTSDTETLYVGLKSCFENTLADLAIAYPGCAGQYRIRFDGKREAHVQHTDGEIIPRIKMKSAVTKTAEGGVFIEAAIPLSCIPLDSVGMSYRPSVKAMLPLGARCDFNLIVMNSYDTTGLSFTSFLPFELNGKLVRQMSRVYQTRLPYPLVYDSKSKGSMYNFPVTPAHVVWPGELKLGVNKIVVNNESGVYSSAKIVIRPSGQPRIELPLTLAAGRQTLDVPLDFPAHTEITVELFDSASFLMALDMRPCSIEKPFHAVTGLNYYTSEKEASIHVRLNYTDGLIGKLKNISVVMSKPDGSLQTVTAAPSPIGAPDEFIARFDISSCPVGLYQTAIDYAVDGRLLHTAGPDIVKRPPAQSEVKIRNDGFISFNGKPLYPLGLLMDQWAVTPDASFIKEGGLNTALYWQEQPQENLDHMLKEGIHLVISPTGLHNGAGNAMVDYAKMKGHIEKLKAYPNLLGYYPIDEPEYWHAPFCVPLQLKAFNEYVASIDPYHPSMISHAVGSIHYDKSEGLTFNDVMDIRIYELYGKPTTIANRFDIIKTVGRNDRAVPMVFLKLGPNVGPEDPVQFRANVYTSFACGARGIFFFLLSSARWTGHELWPEVSKGVCDEVTAMAASRMASNSFEVKASSSNEKIRVLAWRDGGLLWIVATNISEDAVDAQINLEGEVAPSGTAKTMFTEMPSASLEGKILKSSFKRYDVACWTIRYK